MVRTSLITLFTLICICVAIYVIWTLRVSRQRSDDLLTVFKKVDRSLQQSSDSIKNNGTGAFKRDSAYLPEVTLAIRASTISGCIDSIKHELFLFTKQNTGTGFTYPDKNKLVNLKKNLADYNAFIQNKFASKTNIKATDFIDVSDISMGAKKIPWEEYYFRNGSVFGMITELTYINTQVLKLKQKAIH